MDVSGILKNFLDEQGKLKALPAKKKMKLYALYYLAGKLEKGRTYTEAEMNDALRMWHSFNDPATLRRELYNNKLLDRENTGKAYWLEEPQPTVEQLLARLI